MLEIRNSKKNSSSLKMTRKLFVLVFALAGIVNCTKAQTLTWYIGTPDTLAVTATLNIVDSTFTISGTGEMKNYNWSTLPWYDVCGNIKTVLINQGLANIGSYSFFNCNNLISVSIPEEITSIGSSAFAFCSAQSLNSIILPNSLISIEASAFFGSGLTSITIPENVTHIGDDAFRQTSNLASVTIPNSVEIIGQFAFYYSTALTTIDVGTGNTNYSSIDGVLYNKTQETLIQYPAGKQGSLIIPNSVNNINVYCFYGCSGLTSFEVSTSNANYSSFEGILYDKSMDLLLVCPPGKQGAVVIPNGVISIKEQAFCRCPFITSIEISASVSSIGNDVFSGSNINAIICNPIIPPTTEQYTFSNAPQNASIFVHCASLEDYQADQSWSYFTNYHVIESPTPNNVQVFSQQDNSFLITWQSEATIHMLYRDDQLLATVSTTNYIDNDLIENTEYCYKIRAIENECESVFSEEVCKIFNTVGIIQQQVTNFNIYPNPTQNTFFLECENFMTIKLYDMLGKEVLNQTANGKTEISINHLPNGIYTVQILSEDRIMGSSKIVKQ